MRRVHAFQCLRRILESSAWVKYAMVQRNRSAIGAAIVSGLAGTSQLYETAIWVCFNAVLADVDARVRCEARKVSTEHATSATPPADKHSGESTGMINPRKTRVATPSRVGRNFHTADLDISSDEQTGMQSTDWTELSPPPRRTKPKPTLASHSCVSSSRIAPLRAKARVVARVKGPIRGILSPVTQAAAVKVTRTSSTAFEAAKRPDSILSSASEITGSGEISRISHSDYNALNGDHTYIEESAPVVQIDLDSPLGDDLQYQDEQVPLQTNGASVGRVMYSELRIDDLV